MNPNFRNFALWAIIALLLIALFNMFQTPSERTSGREIAYSQFLNDVDAAVSVTLRSWASGFPAITAIHRRAFRPILPAIRA
jgi:ATP-dependent Zn protease